MIRGQTTSGFEFEINEAILKDWRFVKKLSKLSSLEDSEAKEVEFINVMADIEELLFADKGKAFEKHISKNHDGTVPSDVALKELLEIIKSNEKSKN